MPDAAAHGWVPPRSIDVSYGNKQAYYHKALCISLLKKMVNNQANNSSKDWRVNDNSIGRAPEYGVNLWA